MDIRHLKYFATIVEEGKISKAAKRLNIAQPPLSQQLKQLEDELGIQLFERHTRNLHITEEGKIFYEKAKEILDLFHGSIEEMKEISEGMKGTLKIGTIASLGAKILPEKISQFQTEPVDVQFQVWEGDPIRIMELLENRIIELGFVRLPIDTNIFDYISLTDEPIVIAAGEKWNNIGEDDFVELSDLQNKPLMLLRRQTGTSLYNHEMYTFDMVKNACQQQGFEPNIICESGDIMTLLTWAKYNIGIAVVPKSAEDLVEGSGLQFKEIVSPKIQARTPALIWVKGRYLSNIARKFMSFFM